MSERYFAYGSNLCLEQMIERCGSIRQGDEGPRIARLPNYRLDFNMQGNEGQAFANLVYPGDGVFGVVYYCSLETLKIMDAYEMGYERGHVRVVLENGEELNAYTYFAAPTHIGNNVRPSAEYLDKVLRGAKQHGLPEAYIREIESKANGNDLRQSG